MTLLAKRLRLVRTRQGLSQEQLGNRTGSSKHLISQVEQGRCGLTNPRLTSAAQLGKYTPDMEPQSVTV